MTKISVLLPTFNNEHIIRDCLESLKWADEILVVDSFSRDQTLDICREYGARILQHEYVQSAKQKNWAIPQCSHEWVLQVDSDERIEPALQEEIRQILTNPPNDIDAYRLPFKIYVLGQWIKVAGLYPQYHSRLFRKAVGRFEDKEVHAHVRVPGSIATLRHHIIHYGMTSISNQLGNMDRYTRYQADELKKRSRQFRWYQLALRPFAIFAYHYLWQRGFTAGYRGLLIATLNTSSDFWTHAKLWEMETLELDASPK
jgi:glycosyltransferase involved in cell wall biosynthesis